MDMISWRDLRDFERKKRATKEEKEYWAKQIISAARHIFAEHGNFIDAGGVNAKVMKVKCNPFDIIFTTPFNRIIGNRYGLYIWFRQEKEKHGGKVFFVQWEPIDIVRFDRGMWIEKLFGMVPGITFNVT